MVDPQKIPLVEELEELQAPDRKSQKVPQTNQNLEGFHIEVLDTLVRRDRSEPIVTLHNSHDRYSRNLYMAGLAKDMNQNLSRCPYLQIELWKFSQ